VEDKLTNSIAMVGGKVESSVAGRDFGIGIRIFNGLNSVYAYTNQHEREALLQVARQAARAIRGQARPDLTLNLTGAPNPNLHLIRQSPRDIPQARKAGAMREAYNAAREYSEQISQVSVRHLDEDQNVLIANSEGTFAKDRRVRTRLVIEAVAAQGSDMQTGSYGPGAHQGFEVFEQNDVRYHARTPVTMLHAEECPSGRFPVIIDNEFGGVIFHEACGHGMEATAVAKNASVFTGKLGQKIASDIVTYIDDGTLRRTWTTGAPPAAGTC
jgi:TldD protein